MQGRLAFLLAGLLAVQSLSAGQSYNAGVMDEQEAMVLGYRVAAVRAAIQNPELPGALESITELGRDQRYYVMVRGWLAYQLQGDMSIMAASRGQPQEQLSARIRLLERAIRAIDLE